MSTRIGRNPFDKKPAVTQPKAQPKPTQQSAKKEASSKEDNSGVAYWLFIDVPAYGFLWALRAMLVLKSAILHRQA